MAQTVHLKLTANGSECQGESTITSLERENTIECLSYASSVMTPSEESTGRPTGNRSYGPIFITKRIDKSSPLLHKALVNNETIEGEFWFFRPNPAGDGTQQKYFVVKISEGRVTSISRLSPDVTDPSSASDPATESVGFAFGEIIWTYEPNGAEFDDKVREAN